MADKKQIPGAGVPSLVPSKDWPLYEAYQKPVFVNGRLYTPESGERFRSDQKPGKFWKLIEAGRPAAAPAPAGKRSKAAPVEAPAETEGEAGRAADQSPI